MLFFYCINFSDKDQVFSIGRKVKSEVGDVSILINNAGVVVGRKLLATPDHMIEKTFNVNLLGHFWVCINGCIKQVPCLIEVATQTGFTVYVVYPFLQFSCSMFVFLSRHLSLSRSKIGFFHVT